MPVKLYYTIASPPVRAVIYTLKALNVSYELVNIDIFKGDQHSERFLKLNPQHTIPTIEDEDGFAIWESHAINAYLVNKYGKDSTLYSKDPKARAIIDQRLHFDTGVLFPLNKKLVFEAAVRNMHVAYELWRKAMVMRYDPTHPLIPKPVQTPPVEAYEFAKEVQTLEELQELVSDPDAMRVQALLIRERVLGPAHPDTSYYIRFRGAVYADAGRFSRCISLWNYALDMQQSILEPLNPLTQSSLVSFAELFSLMMDADSYNNSSVSRKIPTINFADIMMVLKKCIHEVSSGANMKDKPGFDETHFQRVLIISLHICCVLAKLLPLLSVEQRHDAHSLVYSLVSLRIRGKCNRTFLHYVCTSNTGVVVKYSACQFPCAALVKMLCHTGADVNARDDDGNSPLHLVALSPVYKVDVAHVLLEHGAHLDAVNKSGLAFKDILPDKLHTVVNEVHHTTLACLAARVLRKNSIPFESIVPSGLHAFILQH